MRKTMRVAGGEIIYTIHPGNKYVLMLHGFTLNRTTYEKWSSALQELGYGSIIPDLRNHGESSEFTAMQDLHLVKFVEDIHKILKQENLHLCTIIGFSMGGVIAQAFAATHPKLVDKLILLATSYDLYNTMPVDAVKHERRFKLIQYGYLLRNVYRERKGQLTDSLTDWNAHLADKSLTRDLITSGIYEKASPKRIQGYIHLVESMKQWNTKALLGAIRAPTLLVLGSKDPLVRLDVVETFTKMPGLRHIQILDDGHQFPYTSYDDCWSAIKSFVHEDNH